MKMWGERKSEVWGRGVVSEDRIINLHNLYYVL